MDYSIVKNLKSYIGSFFYTEENQEGEEASNKHENVKFISNNKITKYKKNKTKKRVATIDEFKVDLELPIQLKDDNKNSSSRALRISAGDEQDLFYGSSKVINQKTELSVEGSDSEEALDKVREKIEAMKLEVGDNWLNVYAESKGSTKIKLNKKNRHKQLPMDNSRFQYLNPNSDIIIQEKSKIELKKKAEKAKEFEKSEKNQDFKLEEIKENSIIEEKIKEEEKLLGPKIPVFTQVIIQTKIDNEFPQYDNTFNSLWYLKNDEIEFIDSLDIDPIPYNILTKMLKLEYQQYGLRLEMKRSQNSWPILWDVQLSDQDSYQLFYSLIIEKIRENLKHSLNLYKRFKCVSCGYSDFLADKNSILEKKTLPLPELEQPHTKLLYQEEFNCTKCGGGLMIEFFGDDSRDELTSNINGTNIVKELLTKDEINKNSSDINENNIQNNDKNSKSINDIVIKKEKISVLSELSKLNQYQKKAIPNLIVNNQLKLHLELEILEEGEIVLSWTFMNYLKMEHHPFIYKRSKWEFYKREEVLEDNDSIEEIPGYLLLTNQRILILNTHLKLNYIISFSQLIHVDVGCNRQYLSFHFKLYELTHNQIIEPFKNDKIPANSITIMIRDKVKCTQFINELLVLLYEFGYKKIVNQDILWSIQNLRQNIFFNLNYNLSNKLIPINGRLIPIHKLEDSSMKPDIIVDKVTFEFLKFVGAIYQFNTKPFIQLKPRSIILTPDFLYICRENHKIWPPPIIDFIHLDLTLNPNIKANILKQYNLIEAIFLDSIIKIQWNPEKFSCSLNTKDELRNVNISGIVTLFVKKLNDIGLKPEEIPLPETDEESELPIKNEQGWFYEMSLFFATKESANEFIISIQNLKPDIQLV